MSGIRDGYMNVNFELFKFFDEVVKAGSISKAASSMMISQPAVTQAIKTLENELGGSLFVRVPRGMILTSEGQILYDYIKEGVTYLNNGINKFMSLKQLNSGVINIGATTVISENFLLAYLKKFNQLYPNVEIKITNNLTENLIKDLRNGNLDIIIIAIPNEKIDDIEINSLIDLHDVFVGNKDFKDLKFQSAEQFLKNKILLQKEPSVTRQHFNDYLVKNNLNCNPLMEVASHNLLKNLTLNGLGMSLLTNEFIKDEININLFVIDVPIKIPTRKLGYGIKKNTIPNFSILKFIELLKKL
jgi:DNA-binding transcriptional LysR family regulator